MANPQLENGHTRIANELMEQLMRQYLAPNQWQILLCIIRKTYGFRKKIDYITNIQICEATGLVKSTVSRALNILQNRNLITRNGKHIGLQKDWETWKLPEKLAEQSTKVSGTANCVSGEKLADRKQKLADRKPELAEQLTKVSSPLVTQKEETIQKKLYKRKYGEFQNVLLTDEEYQKLKDKFSNEAEARIENLSSYLASKGGHYKSHYATILNWHRRDTNGKAKVSRALPKSYTPGPEYADI